MERKDRAFLNRAAKVSENYQKRIDTLFQKAEDLRNKICHNEFEAAQVKIKYYSVLTQWNELNLELEAHTEKVRMLRDQQQHTDMINQLCQDANRLAGTDGANFFQKCSKIFEEPQTND